MIPKTEIAEALFDVKSSISGEMAQEILSRIQDEKVSDNEPFRKMDHSKSSVFEALGYTRKELEDLADSTMKSLSELSSISYHVEFLSKLNKNDLAVVAALLNKKLHSGGGGFEAIIARAIGRRMRDDHDDNEED